jgi:hypothetical protein
VTASLTRSTSNTSQKHPTTPTLNALPKLHKPNIPIRPVVNNTNARSHKAAKKLNTILTNRLHLDYEYNTTNSELLTTELKNLKINNNHRLLTLDIKDLYVNIPICETILTKDQLRKYNDKRTTGQITDLLDTILNQNYLSFQDQIYKPDKGVAMGSPVWHHNRGVSANA